MATYYSEIAQKIFAAHSVKLGAALAAALSNGFPDYDVGDAAGRFVALLIEVDRRSDHAAANEAFLSVLAKHPRHVYSSAHLDQSISGIAYLTATVSIECMTELLELACVLRMELASPLRVNRPVVRRPGPASSQGDLPQIGHPNKVLLGVIDHGCPFANRAFRQAKTGTRVRALWDQDQNPDFPVTTGSTPDGFGYGRQLDGQAMDYFMAAATVNGVVDEVHCYELAEYQAMRSKMTHGTHTLGMFASSQLSSSLHGTVGEQAGDVAATSDIAFVQLPRQILLAPSSGAEERHILDGLRYILNCAAKEVSKVVVVVDYGSYQGPHDGTSPFEMAVDALVVEARVRSIELIVVFPSGNGYDKQLCAHIGELKRDAPVQMDWLLPPANDVATFADTWLRCRTSEIALSVRPPGAQKPFTVPISATGDRVDHWPTAADPICTLVVKQHANQTQVFIQVSATGGDDPSMPVAPAGRWQLTFASKDDAVPCDLYTYVGWGGRNIGFPLREQATKLVLPAGESSNVTMRGKGTLISSACGNATYVVGGKEAWGTCKPAPYSSRGPARGGKRAQPGPFDGLDDYKITEESPTLHGIVGNGVLSGCYFRMRGTSVAAPQFARSTA